MEVTPEEPEEAAQAEGKHRHDSGDEGDAAGRGAEREQPGRSQEGEEEEHGGGEDLIARLAPPMGKTPKPTPTVFEWRTDLMRKIESMDSQISSLKEAPRLPGGQGMVGTLGSLMGKDGGADLLSPRRVVSPRSVAPPAPPGPPAGAGAKGKRTMQGVLDLRSFRIAKEFEDEDTAFQRSTTKIAIDVARAETERAVRQANQVQSICVKLEERLAAMESSYASEMREVQKFNRNLQGRLSTLTAEHKIMKEAMDSLQEDSKLKDKQMKDLEEVIFFLQDEIASSTKKAEPPKPATAGGKPKAPAPATGPGKAGGARKAMPSPPPKAGAARRK